jgi:hypothetical protein
MRNPVGLRQRFQGLTFRAPLDYSLLLIGRVGAPIATDASCGANALDFIIDFRMLSKLSSIAGGSLQVRRD